ncbi:MAG: hypothetical protein KME15_07110 [Drouetiella hepatica Uher 2000/2452]|jgi:uncharacterized membrane protein (DUF2068 family)|uniref:DUF2127 domain-containing protein n=1 Tax=Drouetiella hepatica Uher 2000/2452 TaxID=904376 RepID=A0A951QAW4_9CYAN|nr:hypothetical protein [Drouetiella hepatica Uher 2000/2452]
MNRPVGVTIVATLQLVGAILILIGSLGILSFRDAIAQEVSPTPSVAQAGSFVVGFGIFLLLLGLIGLLLAYGLFMLQSWAWVATLVLEGFKTLSNLSTVATGIGSRGIAVFQLVISAIVLYYLLRSEVKRAFGRRAAS